MTVTDPNAGALNCTPQTPVSSLAPGGTITCTASHTITQADIDAGHYLNTACVDATGATQACSGVDVLAATLTIVKTNNAPLESLTLPNKTVASLPTADEGSTVTYTLTYTIGDVEVTNAVITDVLPAGLQYVVGSATSNAEFTFVDYNSTTTDPDLDGRRGYRERLGHLQGPRPQGRQRAGPATPQRRDDRVRRHPAR